MTPIDARSRGLWWSGDGKHKEVAGLGSVGREDPPAYSREPCTGQPEGGVHRHTSLDRERTRLIRICRAWIVGRDRVALANQKRTGRRRQTGRLLRLMRFSENHIAAMWKGAQCELAVAIGRRGGAPGVRDAAAQAHLRHGTHANSGGRTSFGVDDAACDDAKRDQSHLDQPDRTLGQFDGLARIARRALPGRGRLVAGEGGRHDIASWRESRNFEAAASVGPHHLVADAYGSVGHRLSRIVGNDGPTQLRRSGCAFLSRRKRRAGKKERQHHDR